MNFIAKQCRLAFRQKNVLRNFTKQSFFTINLQKYNALDRLFIRREMLKLQYGLSSSCKYCHTGIMKLLDFDHVVNNTLEDLADHFDYLADEGLFNEQYDLTLSDGVLTVNLGDPGTYVINKQTPNRQIWLSSPLSGPKRYDFIGDAWVYSHEPDRTLHELLSNELTNVFRQKVDFSQLSHAKCIT